MDCIMTWAMDAVRSFSLLPMMLCNRMHNDAGRFSSGFHRATSFPLCSDIHLLCFHSDSDSIFRR